ncbi:MAG: hypothetical protein M9953_10255 [Thermomicrobiales bacterium]|nr:hypothetical protein [Thermomicrobiales bacterium]
MNRRTLLGAIAAAPALQNVAAQDTPNPEPQWDETSHLYGNAWNTLPKAEEGTIQFLNLNTGFTSKYGTQIMGIIHNATDTARMLADLLCEDGPIGLIECTQWIIPPGAYALAHGFAQFPLEPGDEIPPIEAFFITPEEAFSPFLLFAESVPLRVDAVSFDLNPDGDEPKHPCIATLTNTSEIDPRGQPPMGMVMFVDGDGIPTMTTALSSSDVVRVGETVDADSIIHFDYDPTEPFLIGFHFTP